MSNEKLEQKKTQIEGRLAEIPDAMRSIELASGYKQQRLVQLEAQTPKLVDGVKFSKSVDDEDAITLAAHYREIAQLENEIAVMERDATPKLRALEKEQEKLQAELYEVNKKLTRDQLSVEVKKYEELMQQAIPVANRIRSLAVQAGVPLESQNLLVYRDEEHLTLCGYPLQI